MQQVSDSQKPLGHDVAAGPQTEPTPTCPVYKWPDTEVDNVSIELALEELGEGAPMRTVVERAQAIKEEFQAAERAQ